MFPRTNFVIGMGSVLNIAGNYFHFNYSGSDEDADRKAIESDWGMIGNDVSDAIVSIKKELHSVKDNGK